MLDKVILSVVVFRLKQCFANKQVLQGHSGQKFFCWIFSQKFLTNLKITFTKFELSMTFCSLDT